MIEDILSAKIQLKFRENGKFRILTLADIHGGPNYSEQLPPALEAIIDAAAPDLVLFGGDNAGLHGVRVENTRELKVLLDMLNAPLARRQIPWAHVFGNHDDNYGCSKPEQEAIYEGYPLCLSKSGPEDIAGVGNYMLPVWSANGDRIAYSIWALDSHNDEKSFRAAFNLPEDVPITLPVHFNYGRRYSMPHPDQVFWYYSTSKALEAHCGRKIPGFMYMHVAVPEMYLVAENQAECGFDGNMREDVGCGELNTGLFAAILQRGDVKTMAFGHDHISDYTGTYCGVLMSYMGSITYDGYQDDDLRGARVYEIDETDGSVRTWMIRVRDLLGTAADNKSRPRGTYPPAQDLHP